jgi:creatinine amidohydrolase
MALIELKTLTWRQATDVARESAVGLIGIGAMEQHGPHLPLITDTLIAEELVRRLGETLRPPIVSVPVLCVGLSDHHLGFAGTVSTTPECLDGQLTAYVRAFTRMSISKVAIVSAHGGNFQFIHEFVSTGAERFPDCHLAGYTDLDRYLGVMLHAAQERGVNLPETDCHAGGLETSQALFLFPKLVGEYASLEGYAVPQDGWRARVSQGIHDVSANGVLGIPKYARPDIGEAIMNALTYELSTWMADEFDLERLAGDTDAVALEGATASAIRHNEVRKETHGH